MFALIDQFFFIYGCQVSIKNSTCRLRRPTSLFRLKTESFVDGSLIAYNQEVGFAGDDRISQTPFYIQFSQLENMNLA